jgi:uncharacterized repeat protein (TIGR01451 family)
MNLRIAGSALPRVLILSLVAVAPPSVARASGPRFPFGELVRLAGVADAIPDRNEQFGAAVAADGDVVIVGAPGHRCAGCGSGAAYIFRRVANAWTLEATLAAPSSNIGDFGYSVAISSETAVVGSSGYGNAVHIFAHADGTWTEQATLQDVDSFGRSVAISGDTLVVGAPNRSGAARIAVGAAMVFVRNGSTWTKLQDLLPADGAQYQAFGHSLSISQDSLVVGSPGYGSYGGGVDPGSAYVFVRSGAVWTQQAKLMGAGAIGDAFGSAVSLDGDRLAVGAPREPPAARGAGYVFLRSGVSWSLEQRIESSRTAGSAWFGAAIGLEDDTLLVGVAGERYHSQLGVVHVFTRAGGSWSDIRRIAPLVPDPHGAFATSIAVAISGSTAVVGASAYDSASGIASIYRGGGSSWSREARVVAPGTSQHELFSSSMAMEGDTLVVGAPGDDLSSGRGRGSAYVFVRTGGGWTLQQKITASDVSPVSAFGASVAVSGDTIAVSTAGRNYREVGPPYTTGRHVYVFVREGGVWRQQAKLTAPGSVESFGFALAVDGDTLVAGTPYDDRGAIDAGSAYVFVRSGSEWSLQQRLADALPVPSANAGYAVAIRGDSVFVGAPSAGIGAVLVFERTGSSWSQRGALSPADPTRVCSFGTALAVSNDTLLVGSPRNGDGSGAAYVFEENGGSWQEHQRLEGFSLPGVGSAVALAGDVAAIGTDFSGLYWPSLLFFERAGGAWTQRQRIDSFGAPYAHSYIGLTVAMSGETVAIGGLEADTPSGAASGAAYIYVPAVADIAVDPSRTPATVAQGDLVTFKMAVTNLGATAAPDVQFAASVSAGLALDEMRYWPRQSTACTTTSTSGACPLGTIGAGETITVTLVAFAAGLGEQTVEASVLGAGSDPNPGSNAASVTTTVVPGAADLAVTMTKRHGVVATVGSTLEYDITLRNTGTDTAVGVILDDAIPSGLVLNGVSGDCTSLPCSFSRMAPSQVKTVSVAFAVPSSYPGPDPVVNTATVRASSHDPNPANDASTVASPFFVPAPPMTFYTLAPCRLIDTRAPSSDGPLAAGILRSIYPYSQCNIPFTARALAVSVTVTEPTTSGHVKLYPWGIPVPNISTLSYGAGQTRGSNAVVSLTYGSGLSARITQPSGTAHVIIDVFGYFE